MQNLFVLFLIGLLLLIWFGAQYAFARFEKLTPLERELEINADMPRILEGVKLRKTTYVSPDWEEKEGWAELKSRPGLDPFD